MRKELGLRLLILLSVLGLIAAACGGSDTEEEAATETTEADETTSETTTLASTTVVEGEAEEEEMVEADPNAHLLRPENVPTEDQKGGTVVLGYGVGAFNHMNGAIASGYATNIPGSQVNASLLRWSDDYEPVPYLAESWEIADDGLSVTLNLRENARFHDGEDITCTDVDFSIKASQDNHPFKPMFAPVTGVDGGDTKTCTVNLSQPHPALLIAFSPGLLPIIPEHVYNDGQELATHPRNTTDIVGSGPFKVVEFDPTEIIRLERNDDFFLEGLPYLDAIIIDAVPDPATVRLGLETGEYDLGTTHAGQDIIDAQANPDLKVSTKGFEAIGSIPWIQLNLRDPILGIKEVRQALAYAYDMDEYIEVITLGLHRRQCGPVQSQSPYYDPADECYDRDVEKAKELLAEAGYPDGFKLTWHTAQPSSVPVAELVAAQWAEIGVEVEIIQLPGFVDWIGVVVGEDETAWQVTDTSLWNWGDPVIGVNRSYNCDNRITGVVFSNMSWYCNEEVDQLLADAGLSFDTDVRADLYHQAADTINDEVPVIYLSNQVFAQVQSLRLQNPPESIWGYMDSWAEMWVTE